MSKSKYNEDHIKFIKELKDADYNWTDITLEFNKKYKTLNTIESIRKALQNTSFNKEELVDVAIVRNLKALRKKTVENTALKKQQDVVIDQQLSYDDVLEAAHKIVSSMNLKAYKPSKVSYSKEKKNMIIEPMLSDLHYGLKTKSYDFNRTRRSVKEVGEVLLKDIKRHSISYNIKEINVLLNGDLIQSATMHKNSHASCNLTNAEQLAVAIESLFEDFLAPVAMSGHKVKVIAMSGNHDRESSERFTVDPGKNYYSHTIYKTLELLCKKTKLNNVSFIIPDDGHYVYEIFGSHFLVEHGDAIPKGSGGKSLEDQINKRSAQVKKIIKGIRIGHYHNDYIGNIGRHIINGSPVTDDHYGNMLGYISRPCQVINYYVESDRDTPYFYSFVVNLEEV